MFHSMTYPEYDALPGLRWHQLQHMRRSPLHYKYFLDNDREDTAELAQGRALHTAVFEPERFMHEYVMYGGDKVKYRKEWQQFKANHASDTILTPDQYEAALRMRDRLHGHAQSGSILSHGRPEVAIQWVDAATNIKCKARIDWLKGPRLFYDLKSSRTIQKHRFDSMAWGMGYYQQIAFYRGGIATLEKCKPEEVTGGFIVIESTDAHDILVTEPDEDTMDAADKEVRGLLDKLAVCLESKRWPGQYEEKIEQSRAPVYVLDDSYDWSVSSKEEDDA